MNSFMEDNLAEERRKDIVREVNNIRLQEEALKNKDFRSMWFLQPMRSFVQWLIAHGEKLVRQYQSHAHSAKVLPPRRKLSSHKMH